MPPIRAGDVPPGLGTPATYVTVERDDGGPLVRVDVYEREAACYAFEEVVAWSDFIVIGFGRRVHFVSPNTWSVATIALSGYFGHLYPLAEHLLVADARYLHCFDRAGAPLWRSDVLGIDGVTVERVIDEVIEDDGEWDPPGGWRPFRILLSSGELAPTET